MAYVLPKYKKRDFKKVSWAQYGKTLELLHSKIDRHLKASKTKIDFIVPIMRGGAVGGAYLSYRLGILSIFPIQYHYFFEGKKSNVRRLTVLPKLNVKAPKILLVEGNHCFGTTAKAAMADLNKAYPNCKIIYAAVHLDYSFRAVPNVKTFYGKLTNETRTLNPLICKRKGIDPNAIYLFPWESLDEEWASVSGKQYKYQDLQVLKASPVAKRT